MSESIEKLRPDRDLQCFFFRPSAIAALSNATPSGYTVSGTWRQQFDWTVVEWNRNNVYEHPNLRNLPDGDLSGLTLTYNEQRTNCIAVNSDLFPTVDWPYLRFGRTMSGVLSRSTASHLSITRHRSPARSLPLKLCSLCRAR